MDVKAARGQQLGEPRCAALGLKEQSCWLLSWCTAHSFLLCFLTYGTFLVMPQIKS